MSSSSDGTVSDEQGTWLELYEPLAVSLSVSVCYVNIVRLSQSIIYSGYVPDMNVDELDWYWFADGSCFSWRIDF